MIAGHLARGSTGSLWTTGGLVALGVALTVATASALAGGRSELGLYIAGLLTFAFCFMAWRPAVYGAFVLLFVEGYLRNRLNSPDILLVKDLMLAAIYLRVFGERFIRGQALVPATPANIPIAVFVLIVLIQCLNPAVTSIGQALVGIRTWLYYIPLYYIGIYMLRSEREVRRFLWFMLVCAVPICLLAIYQHRQGPAEYAAYGDAFRQSTFVTTVGDVEFYRPNATFSWPSHFASFLTLVTLVCLGVILSSAGRARTIALAIMLLVVGVNIIEGQRTAYVLLSVATLLVLGLRGRLYGAAIAALLAIAVVLVVSQLTNSAGTERLRELQENRGDVVSARAQAAWLYTLAAVEISPIGIGTGATAIGARYVGGQIPLFLEMPLAKVIAELSAVGLVVYLWLLAALCLVSLRAERRAATARDSRAADILAVVLAVQLLAVYGGYELAIVAIPFWFLSGMAVALTRGVGEVETASPAKSSPARSWLRAGSGAAVGLR
jgi:hypothetical protein